MKVLLKAILIGMLVAVLSLAVFSLSQNGEVASPSDWIKTEQVKVFNEKVVLDIPGAKQVGLANTNSMDPFMDESTHVIEISPQEGSIQVGDIISYQTALGNVIHRVVEINQDENGTYYLVKGDNNPVRDPFKVRFSDVKGVVVAVIY